MSHIRFAAAAAMLGLAALLSGCGSGSDSANVPVTTPPAAGPPGTPAQVQGIAIPRNIAVVTAINAS